MRKLMLALVLSASAAMPATAESLQPCCSDAKPAIADTAKSAWIPVTETEVANLTNVALLQNGLNEHSARRIQVGQTITIDGVTMKVSAGDTVWTLSERRLLDQKLETELAALEKLCEDIARLMADSDRLLADIENMRPRSMFDLLFGWI